MAPYCWSPLTSGRVAVYQRNARIHHYPRTLETLQQHRALISITIIEVNGNNDAVKIVPIDSTVPETNFYVGSDSQGLLLLMFLSRLFDDIATKFQGRIAREQDSHQHRRQVNKSLGG